MIIESDKKLLLEFVFRGFYYVETNQLAVLWMIEMVHDLNLINPSISSELSCRLGASWVSC